MDGCHFLSGATEAASSPSKPHNILLVCILPLQPHHCKAADVAECGPGRWPGTKLFTAKVDIYCNSVQFIDEPLAYLTVCYTRVADYFSPNSVSLIGVLVAAIAAKFFAKEELKYRQFGVLLFKVGNSFKRNLDTRLVFF